MSDFATTTLPPHPTALAPDGSACRALLGLGAGGLAHFELGAGRISSAVAHRTVEEIWYVVGGRGRMWRRQGTREEETALVPGTCLTVPLGTHFQFRADDGAPLSVVVATMPPWPGHDEAIAVDGPWRASTAAPPGPPAAGAAANLGPSP